MFTGALHFRGRFTATIRITGGHSIVESCVALESPHDRSTLFPHQLTERITYWLAKFENFPRLGDVLIHCDHECINAVECLHGSNMSNELHPNALVIQIQISAV